MSSKQAELTSLYINRDSLVKSIASAEEAHDRESRIKTIAEQKKRLQEIEERIAVLDPKKKQ